jgi:hypothetical protein
LKRLLFNLAKVAISLAILGYVIYLTRLEDSKPLQRLVEAEKQWPALVAAFALCAMAVSLTFFRWYLLVRAIDLPFRVRDAFRLGFIGYLFNFVSLGSVGGDLFKAVFIAREQPLRRAEAVASVVVDRVVGLLALLLIAIVAVSMVDLDSANPKIRSICHAALAASAVGWAIALFTLFPGATSGRIARRLNRLPLIGRLCGRLLGAIEMYRRNFLTVFFTVILSLVSHGLFALSIYFIAEGLDRQQAVTLAEHFIIVPLGWFVQALPLPGQSLGAFELAMKKLYELVPATPAHNGLIIALGYRAITIVIAAVGIVYYVTRRREVKEAMSEAQAEATP